MTIINYSKTLSVIFLVVVLVCIVINLDYIEVNRLSLNSTRKDPTWAWNITVTIQNLKKYLIGTSLLFNNTSLFRLVYRFTRRYKIRSCVWSRRLV